MSGSSASEPPSPLDAESLDDLSSRLAELRNWAGAPSYSELVRRISAARAARRLPASEGAPGRVTVYDCFRPGRRRLDIELVVDIVSALGAGPRAHQWRAAHRRILGGPGGSQVVRVHDRLPPRADRFVGRGEELRALTARTSGVSAIVGMPGVGKTELALQAAHACSAAFDTVHYVNLRGYDAHQPPVDPLAALESLLRHLGSSPNDVHLAGLERRTTMLRAAAVRTRMLLLIDNARDVDQVLPLLPGGDTRVLVTSRRALEITGAERLTLSSLDPPDAVALLAGAGGGFEHPDDPAARRLAELCGHLPLHLKVLSGHLADTPTWSMEDQVQRLEAIPPEHAVQAALDASYAGLTAPEQHLLRHLSLHPGQGVSVAATAALCGRTLREASALLDRLVAEHLVEVDTQGLHRLHDVIDAFAVRMGRAKDPASARAAAFERLLDHYLVCVTTATGHIRPSEAAIASDSTPLLDLSDPETARDWLRGESENIVATALAAGQSGHEGLLASVAEALQPWLEADVRFGDMERLYAAMAESDDPLVRRDGARHLGRVHDLTGQLDEALRWSEKAVEGEGRRDIAALNQLGNVLVRLARLDEAAATFEAGLEAAQRASNRMREGRLLGNLASVHRLRGDLSLSEAQFDRALVIAREVDDLENVSILCTNRSDVLAVAGRYDEAIADLRQSIDLDVQLGLRQHTAGTLTRMAGLCSAREDHAAALGMLDEAMELAEEFGEPIYLAEALNVRARVRLLRDNPADARADRLRARRIGEDTGSTWLVIDATNGLAEISLHENDPRTAARHFTTALAGARHVGVTEEIDRAEAGLEACLQGTPPGSAPRPN